MSRSIQLNALKAGINRLRIKGGADPSSLYDLVNGYVTIDGSVVSRPGTLNDVTLPAGTKGLCAFDGKMHVFALSALDPGDARYIVDILIHPDPDFTGTLVAIHFANPFLGELYVVAEFSDGQVFHYWLQQADAWQAGHFYKAGDNVRPSVANGFTYTPSTQEVPASWQPTTTYAIGDRVQPTVYNGYQYELVEMDGDNPASGATEPTWIASEGALVTEDVDKTTTPSTPSSAPTGSPGGTRYDNLPSYKQNQPGAVEP